MPSTGRGRVILVIDGDPLHENNVSINFLFLDLIGGAFHVLILTFGHCWELLIGILLYWKVHEVLKMMEVKLGGGWIFHKKL